MDFHGIHDLELGETVEFFTSREGAERELALMLRDKPDWVGRLEVVAVDFGDSDATVASLS